MILLVTLNNDTATNPTITSLIEELQKNGNELVLFSLVTQKFDLKIPVIQLNINFGSKLDILLKLFVIAYKIINIVAINRPKLIIGIDPPGVIVASIIHKLNKLFRRSRLHYWSFEIFSKQDGLKALKSIEKIACSDVSYLLIQDEFRFQMLNKENNLNPNIGKAFIPVSYMDEEDDLTDQKAVKAHLAKNELKIIVWGTIAHWSGLEWIERLVIPDGISLVVHSRFKLEEGNPVLKALSGKKNILLHHDYFHGIQESLDYLRTFDFGLCLYLPQNEHVYLGSNLELVGLSSGKLSMFAQAGLPIIANNFYHTRLIDQYQCGLKINSFIDLQNLLKSIGGIGIKEIVNMGIKSREMYEHLLNPRESIQTYVEQILLHDQP